MPKKREKKLNRKTTDNKTTIQEGDKYLMNFVDSFAEYDEDISNTFSDIKAYQKPKKKKKKKKKQEDEDEETILEASSDNLESIDDKDKGKCLNNPNRNNCTMEVSDINKESDEYCKICKNLVDDAFTLHKQSEWHNYNCMNQDQNTSTVSYEEFQEMKILESLPSLNS